jgi:hypothetical protein
VQQAVRSAARGRCRERMVFIHSPNAQRYAECFISLNEQDKT